jgi:hypothetical protein
MADTDEAKLVEERNLAHRAKMIMEDPIVQGAFNGLRERMQKDWRDTPLYSPEGEFKREQIKRLDYLLGRLEFLIGQHLLTGQLAVAELEKIYRKPRPPSAEAPGMGYKWE